MKRSSGSLGDFFQGYRKKEQEIQAQDVRPVPQATDVLDLFARKKVEHLTMFEISSQLMLSPQQAGDLVKELVNRRLVSIESGEKGNDVVELTKRGKVYIQE